ncbi:MAG: hypothetical protein ACLTSX_10710 [Collinsella sp.]
MMVQKMEAKADCGALCAHVRRRRHGCCPERSRERAHGRCRRLVHLHQRRVARQVPLSPSTRASTLCWFPGGRDQVLDLLRTLVETLVNQKVADGANSLFDLIKFAYGDHLHGDETCPEWVETATAQIKLTGDDAEGNPAADGSLTSFLRATINDEVVLDKLNALLKGIKINLKDLLVKEKGNIAIDIALGAIKDLGAIFGLLGGTPGNMIPNIPTLADLAHGALYSLTHDENQLGDRVNTLATGLVDPDWKPGGGSTGGDGGNGNGGGSGSGNGSTGGGNGNGSNGGNGTSGSGSGDSTGGNGTGGSTGGSGNGGSTRGSGSTRWRWRQQRQPGGNGGSSGSGFGTGNGSTSGSGGSASAITWLRQALLGQASPDR